MGYVNKWKFYSTMATICIVTNDAGNDKDKYINYLVK